jgi:hypothetical protein
MENSSRTIGLRVVAGVAVAALIIVAVFASGVQLPTTDVPILPLSPASDVGMLSVFLKDAPVEVDKLWVTISGLQVHRDNETGGEWIDINFSVVAEELTFNLLEFQDGKMLPLADVEVPTGNYTKIRMEVVKAEAWYYNETAENPEDQIIKDALRVPSGKIDVITKFSLNASESVVVVIDMQPDFVSISHSGNLKPVLKATVTQSQEDD